MSDSVFEFKCEIGAFIMGSCDDEVGVLWGIMGFDWAVIGCKCACRNSGLAFTLLCFGEKIVLGSTCVLVLGGGGMVVF